MRFRTLVRRVRAPWVALLPGVVLSGCAAAPSVPGNPLAIDAREYDRVYAAAEAELTDAGFVLDRRDHRFGRIATEPMDVPTAWEFWEATPASPAHTGPATLGHLRRRVNVLLMPRDAGPVDGAAEADDGVESGLYDFEIEVLVERAQRPARRLSGTAGQDVFAPLDAPPLAWQERGIASTYWQPIGRDTRLEARLLRAIIERSLQPSSWRPRSRGDDRAAP